MPQIETPHGTFTLSHRASWGFSVVQATRECRHRYVPLHVGQYATVEHRKPPLFREHVGIGWCRHVATYDLAGNEIALRAAGGE